MEVIAPMGKFGATLHQPWKAGGKPEEIIGYWAEDLNTYTVVVPPQLRDDIIEMQNALCKRYSEIEAARTKLRNLERDASKFLEGSD